MNKDTQKFKKETKKKRFNFRMNKRLRKIERRRIRKAHWKSM